MRILAVIAARAGSKRVPRKNLRQLGGKPLVVWSIDVAKNISDVCDILVSTDDTEIATLSEGAGAHVPWLRPVQLATDAAPSVDVALHALEWYEAKRGAVDGLLLLQPTSPFRTRATIERGMELFRDNRGKAVVGVSPVEDHPFWTLKIVNGHLVPFTSDDGFGLRSQDLPPAYVINGSFYLISPMELRATRSFLAPQTVPLLMKSPVESLDIDTEWDFQIAEAVAKGILKNGRTT